MDVPKDAATVTKLNWEKNNAEKRALQHGRSRVFMLEMPLSSAKRVAGKRPKHTWLYRPRHPHRVKGTGGKRWVIREVQRDTQIRCTKTDKAHLAHGTASEEAFLDDIDTTIRLLVRNGFRDPRHQAAMLNRIGKRTAINERWDARVVILFYERMNKLRVSRGLPEITPKRTQKTFTIIEKIDDYENIDDYMPGEWGRKRNKLKKRNPTRKKRKLMNDQRCRARKAAQNVVVEHVRKPRKVTTDIEDQRQCP